MINSLDVVPVRIEHKRRVVPGMVWALTRRAVVLPAVCKAGPVEGFNHCTITGLESKVMAACQLALSGLTVGGRNEKLVTPEIVLGSATNTNRR
jgi:hypothetical protein